MTPEERERITDIRRRHSWTSENGASVVEEWYHNDIPWLLDLVERQVAENRAQFGRIEALEICARGSWCQCGHQLMAHDLKGCYGCGCKALHAVYGRGEGVAS